MTIKYRLTKEDNIVSLCTALSAHDFSHIFHVNDVSVAFEEFIDVIMHYYNISCPVVTRNVSYKDILKPWIDDEVKREIRLKNSFLKLYGTGRMRRETYNRIRNEVVKLKI